MRLLTRKIYRAFPELDSFSDEQCVRFVKAVNASKTRLVIRGLISTVFAIGLGIVFLGLAIWGATELADAWHFSEGLFWVFWGVSGTLALLFAFIPGLILGDLLLRLSVRSLLKRCGACPQCGYSLLGIRVGPEFVITCPECGRKVDVDPALDELATDVTGAPVYRPKIVREDAESVARRKRRRRKIMKWTAIVFGSIVLFAAAGYGVFWGAMCWQANSARAARNSMEAVRKAQAAAWPGVSGVDQHKEWATYVEIATLAVQLERTATESGKYKTDAGEDVYFDFTVISPGVVPAKYDADSFPPRAYAAARRRVMDAIAEIEASGTRARLREITTLQAPLRKFIDPGERSFFAANDLEGLGPSRALARLNAARMIAALNDRDRAEYLDALEQTLAAARIIDAQGFLIDRLVANAIRTLVTTRVSADAQHYPDSTWFEAVGKVLREHDARAPLADMLEMERITILDYVQWFFSDAGRVRNKYFGIRDDDDPDIDLSNLGLGSAPIGLIGTHGRNVQALNLVFRQIDLEANKPLGERSGLVLPTSGLVLVDRSVGHFDRAIKNDTRFAYDYRVCIFSLAVERFRRERGCLPRKPEMAELGLPPEFLLDPLNEKPFGVRARIGPVRNDEYLFSVDGGGEAADEPSDEDERE